MLHSKGAQDCLISDDINLGSLRPAHWPSG